MRRMRSTITCVLLGTGLGCAGAAVADEPAFASPLSMDGKAFGRLTWTEHLRDWRSRLIGERATRIPALGWVATHLDTNASSAGWSFDVDPGDQKFVLKYRIRY
ncbi:MAG: hypothetical protein WCE48_05875 [Steroidobacteraceae bacterium]